MIFKRLTLSILAFVGTAVCALAQEPETPATPISEQQAVEDVVVVEELGLQTVAPDVMTEIHNSAQEAINKYNAQTSPKEVYKGYRIRIFASHTQSARTEAEAAIALFEEHFKAPVYFVYENPYFIVTAGNCLTHEEAIVHLSKVKRIFPKAFIVTCDIPAEALTSKPIPRTEHKEVVPEAAPEMNPEVTPEPTMEEETPEEVGNE